MAKIKITGIKGMNDMLPEDAGVWEKFEDAARSVAASYGYRQIRTPILEATGLFSRGVGEATDIVEKEMYSFTDSMNGEQLTLRPECTSAVCRCAIEHNITYNAPQRLWYFGPMFRHERPQRGRYRQFYQFGCEALGFAGPDVDIELLSLTADFGRILASRQACNSTVLVRPKNVRVTVRLWSPISKITTTCSTKTHVAALKPTLSESSIRKIRICRRWWKPHRV